MGKLTRAIGLMSGTSMDGIDVALIDTDGENIVRRGPTATYPYSDTLRKQLRAGLLEAAGLERRDQRPGRLRLLEQYLTDLHIDAVGRFFEDYWVDPSEVQVVGLHGHTVLHRDDERLVVLPRASGGVTTEHRTGAAQRRHYKTTVQLGDGMRLAQMIGIDVVYDLRAADCAQGGQGAPLAPVYHRGLLSGRLEPRPIAFVNLGGVANVTWIGRDGALLAFDTGPGNGMIDDWMLKRTGHPCDPDGRQAAQGQVREDYLNRYLARSYFGEPPPKSLDRDAFALELVDPLSTSDGAATLTAFAAKALAKAREHFPEQPALWVVAGGGRHNKTLMSMIAGLVENAVVPAEAIGVNGDSIEAEAWAYLAVRSLKGLPITFPGTTGVRQPTRGGVLAKP